jgi:hypothetical protein
MARTKRVSQDLGKKIVKIRSLKKLFLFSALCLALFLVLGGTIQSSASFVSSAYSSQSASHDSPKTTNPTFVWFFGYVGSYFYPQTQLNLSQSQLITVAGKLSRLVGNTSLQLVTAVSQIPGQTINWSNATLVSQIKSYVSSLRSYASVVYGRIDLFEFNQNSFPSIYTQLNNYTKSIDLNGVWLDHAAEYYNKVGKAAFNAMMQNITVHFPQLHFIMNHTEHRQLITPLNHTTWENATYVAPSAECSPKTYYCNMQMSLISGLNKLFPGHIVVHLDAYAVKPHAPMSVFSNYNDVLEQYNLGNLAHLGSHPKNGNQDLAFVMLYPIVGAWTYKYGQYNGTLYNSLPNGNFKRSTYGAFTKIMVENLN